MTQLARPTPTREAVLAWMQDLAPYGLFTTDEALVVQTWNQWMVTHSGRTAAEAIGRPLFELFPDLPQRKLDERFARALDGEISILSAALHKYLLPFPPVTREFDVGQMLQTARIAPLFAGKRIVGTISFIEDVTQRECQASGLRRQQEHDRLLSLALETLLKAERPLEIAETLFPRLAAPLKLEVFFNYLLSPDGQELRLQSAAGVTAEARKTLAVQPVGGSLCGQAVLRREPVIENFVQAGLRPEVQSMRRLGLRSYAGFPLAIGDRLLGTLSFGSYERDSIERDEIEFLTKIALYVAIALDRSVREEDLRVAQGSLRTHAQELESKVAARTAELNETIVQLESFSYTIAHDLRAPIRSLTGFAEILLSDFGSLLPPNAQHLVQRLERNARGLDALTRDLLKFSRVARQEVTLAPVDVGEVAEEAVSLMSSPPGDVTIDSASLGSVWAQRTLLQQCLSNLLDNAVKFMPADRVPRIRVRGEQRGENVRIWVEDNGIGVPLEAREKIFGIFERIPGPVPVEGTGVGLAIVARAAQQMGGTCGVESVVGEGSRFWLEFRQRGPA